MDVRQCQKIWRNNFFDNPVKYTSRHLPGAVHTWISRGQHWHRDKLTSIIYYSKNINKQWMYSYITKTAKYFTWATESTSLQHFLHAFTLCVINKTPLCSDSFHIYSHRLDMVKQTATLRLTSYYDEQNNMVHASQLVGDSEKHELLNTSIRKLDHFTDHS